VYHTWLLVIHVMRPIFYCFLDTGRLLSKNVNFHTSAFNVPLRGLPSIFCDAVWVQKLEWWPYYVEKVWWYRPMHSFQHSTDSRTEILPMSRFSVLTGDNKKLSYRWQTARRICVCPVFKYNLNRMGYLELPVEDVVR